MKTKLNLSIKITLLLSFAVFAASSCKLDCKVMPAYFAAYLPYHEGEVLVFADGTGDTIRFSSLGVYVNAETACRECGCEPPHCGFTATIHMEGEIHVYFAMYDTAAHIECKIDMPNFYSYRGIDLPFDASGSVLACGDTIRITNMDKYIDDKRDSIDSLFIVRNKGIVRFHIKETDVYWTKVE